MLLLLIAVFCQRLIVCDCTTIDCLYFVMCRQNSMSESSDGSVIAEGIVEQRLIEDEESVEGNVSAMFL